MFRFAQQNYKMGRVRLPGTNIEISALWLGVAEINVRQTEADAYRRNVV